MAYRLESCRKNPLQDFEIRFTPQGCASYDLLGFSRCEEGSRIITIEEGLKPDVISEAPHLSSVGNEACKNPAHVVWARLEPKTLNAETVISAASLDAGSCPAVASILASSKVLSILPEKTAMNSPSRETVEVDKIMLIAYS